MAGEGRAVRRRDGALGGEQQGLRRVPERERELGTAALPARVPVQRLRWVLSAVPDVPAVCAGILCTLQSERARQRQTEDSVKMPPRLKNTLST